MFDNISEFKGDFTPLLKDFDIKSVLTIIKNPQAKTPVEWVHKVILNMLVTKDIDIRVFNHIDPWGENLAYIAWVIRDSYHHTIMATLGQDVFGRYKIISLASVIDWKVVTTEKQRQAWHWSFPRKIWASHS